VSLGWARDTRDDILYPTRGVLQVAGVEVGVPIVDLSYYKANYLIQWFWPIYGDFCSDAARRRRIRRGYGGKPLPFYKVFYGGGVGSVRGYETATLGPRDLAGNPLGGERKIIGNAELFYPLLKGDKSVRGSVFVDAGKIAGVPGLGRRARASRQTSRSSGFRTASVSRGTPPSGRSSSATHFRSIRDPRPDPEVPVPGRIRVLGAGTSPQEKRLNRSISRVVAALFAAQLATLAALFFR
jgi:outer membrane protein assembly factor BamA